MIEIAPARRKRRVYELSLYKAGEKKLLSAGREAIEPKGGRVCCKRFF